jgi:hypothetical protein
VLVVARAQASRPVIQATAVHSQKAEAKKNCFQMGTAKPCKKQDLSVRKKQNLSVRKPSKKQDLSVRKKADHNWTNTPVLGPRGQSDAELQQEFQLRFEALGGVGIVSPQKATLRCRTKSRFFGKWDTKVGRTKGHQHAEKE